MVHIYAGNLLMTTGSYEDATKVKSLFHSHNSTGVYKCWWNQKISFGFVSESESKFNNLIQIFPV